MSNKLVLFWRESWLLMISSAVFGGLLAMTSAAWSPRIEQNQKNKFAIRACGQAGLLKTAVRVEAMPEKIPVTMGNSAFQVNLFKGLSADGACQGWVFQVEASGYADKIIMVVAANPEFDKLIGFDVLACSETPGFGDKIIMVVAANPEFDKLIGFDVLACSETPGFGDKIMIKGGFYQAQFQGAPAGELSLVKMGDDKKIDAEIVAITGATVTSRAVVDAFNTFIPAVKEAATQKGYIH